jgi:hypothetical protein
MKTKQNIIISTKNNWCFESNFNKFEDTLLFNNIFIIGKGDKIIIRD